MEPASRSISPALGRGPSPVTSPHVAAANLEASTAMLEKWNTHHGDRTGRLEQENVYLKRLLKNVLLKVGGVLTVDIEEKVGYVPDMRPDISPDRAVHAAEMVACPKPGEGRWFQIRRAMIDMEQREVDMANDATSAQAREQHLRRAIAAAEAQATQNLQRVDDVVEQYRKDIEEKDAKIKALDEEIVARSARQLEVENELQTIQNAHNEVNRQSDTIDHLKAEMNHHLAGLERLDKQRQLSLNAFTSVIAADPVVMHTVEGVCEAYGAEGKEYLQLLTAKLPQPLHSPIKQLHPRTASVSPRRLEDKYSQELRSPTTRGESVGHVPATPAMTPPTTTGVVLSVTKESAEARARTLRSPVAAVPIPTPGRDTSPRRLNARRVPHPVASPPKHGSAVVLRKQPQQTMGLLWSTAGHVLILRGVDPHSPASASGCEAFIGRRLVSACGVPIRTTESLSAVTSPMTAVDFIFDDAPDRPYHGFKMLSKARGRPTEAF